MDETINKVKNTISRYDMIRTGDRVVVAVSGGPDSVCLLYMLHELESDLGIGLLVAHFDHGIRPEDDEAESRFVKSLASTLGLSFETKKAALSGVMPGPLEERARHARYGFLEQVKEKYAAQKIAVGHNLNDQAETVLMRLLRGSGVSGLAGIPPVREGHIIRPLIETTRKDIMAYIEQRGLDYVTDSSNFETRFLRNRIRLEILPGLKEVQPQIIEILGQTAGMMRRDEAWMDAVAVEWVHSIAQIGGDQAVSIPLTSFSKLPDALKSRVIRQMIKKTTGTLRRITRRHIGAVERLTASHKPQACIHLPGQLIAKRVYDRLIFTKGKQGFPDAFSYTLSRSGTYHLDAVNRQVSLKEINVADLPKRYVSQWTAFLDADQISYPLIIRNFRAGDRFMPLGMSGHRKLKDFFIDLKIPAEDRSRIPILTCNDRLVWVCGYRIDERFKITSGTRKVLEVGITDSDDKKD